MIFFFFFCQELFSVKVYLYLSKSYIDFKNEEYQHTVGRFFCPTIRLLERLRSSRTFPRCRQKTARQSANASRCSARTASAPSARCSRPRILGKLHALCMRFFIIIMFKLHSLLIHVCLIHFKIHTKVIQYIMEKKQLAINFNINHQ